MSAQVAPRRISGTRWKLAIERVEVFGVAVPLAGGGFKNAYVTKTVQKSAVVRVTAAGGAVGLGNIDPSPGYSTETIEESLAALRGKLAAGVIGADAANIHVLNARLDAAAPGFLDAKAAIEMACVDLTARALGVPVHAYLGGAVKERLMFNAWIGIVPPGEAAAEGRKWFERGFRPAKSKGGGGSEGGRSRHRQAQSDEAGRIPPRGRHARHRRSCRCALRRRTRIRAGREHHGGDHARRHQRERDRRAGMRGTAQDRGRYHHRKTRPRC